MHDIFDSKRKHAEIKREVLSSMLFVISGRMTPDVGLSSGKLSKDLEKEINRQLRGVELSTSLNAIVLFPTILNPEIALMSDKVTYKRDGSVFAALSLSHSEWMKSAERERIDLLAENISASLKKIKEKSLPPEDRVKLLDMVERARQKLKEK